MGTTIACASGDAIDEHDVRVAVQVAAAGGDDSDVRLEVSKIAPLQPERVDPLTRPIRNFDATAVQPASL
eukprot:2730773-Prymnesium_polylepis.2